ncbi:MAG: hypothetical protein KDB23_34455, partial [Planctomycetales bacterium]|nr:hypothetical protein [Planctomycetales bacterium]
MNRRPTVNNRYAMKAPCDATMHFNTSTLQHFNTQHFNTQHSTLNTQHSTLNTQHSTLNTSTLNTQ